MQSKEELGKKKLIKKLKERIKELDSKSGGNTYHVQAIINAKKKEVEEILKALLEEN